MCARPRATDDGSRAHASSLRDRFPDFLLGAFLRPGDGAVRAEKPPDSTSAGAKSRHWLISCGPSAIIRAASSTSSCSATRSSMCR